MVAMEKTEGNYPSATGGQRDYLAAETRR